MSSLTPQPIPNIPALFFHEMKLLVIADLHIGIENELREYGVHATSKTTEMKQQLQNLCEVYKPEEIIILGDVKHTIPSSPFIEKKEIHDFLRTLQEYGIIHIVPGNHDGGIQKMIPKKIMVHSSDGFIHGPFGFLHGHRWPHNELLHCEQIIFGHTHPSVMLTDRLGFQTYETCWIKGRFLPETLNEKYKAFNQNLTYLIVPAFNPLCGGIAVNKDGIVGPLKNIINLQDGEVYLLDGSALGAVKDIP